MTFTADYVGREWADESVAEWAKLGKIMPLIIMLYKDVSVVSFICSLLFCNDRYCNKSEENTFPKEL